MSKGDIEQGDGENDWVPSVSFVTIYHGKRILDLEMLCLPVDKIIGFPDTKELRIVYPRANPHSGKI
ncbi:hypothetical protein OUZ56_021619 [Daphnia magna]|uniref:Uncharacterized protein n=1 Tax=Daphnia magna TaxID=35525 RepID=A0ABR0AU02_9CRUS|nr:hypothetical protein OUZ56_021619 [Daphnia magna]